MGGTGLFCDAVEEYDRRLLGVYQGKIESTDFLEIQKRYSAVGADIDRSFASRFRRSQKKKRRDWRGNEARSRMWIVGVRILSNKHAGNAGTQAA